MSLSRIRTHHVYVSAAVAFVLLVGFEGSRMALGHDPALAARSNATPAAVPEAPALPDGSGVPDDGSSAQAPDMLPQPETRLS